MSEHIVRQRAIGYIYRGDDVGCALECETESPDGAVEHWFMTYWHTVDKNDNAWYPTKQERSDTCPALDYTFANNVDDPVPAILID